MRTTLVVNPRFDPVFAHEVNLVMASGADTAAALQRALRPHFPNVVVHERLLSDERDRTWYVYRYGVWVASGLSASQLTRGSAREAIHRPENETQMRHTS